MDYNKQHNQENHLHSQNQKQFDHSHNMKEHPHHIKRGNENVSTHYTHKQQNNQTGNDEIQNKHETEILSNLNRDEHHTTHNSQNQHFQKKGDEEEFKTEQEKEWIKNQTGRDDIKNQYDFNLKERNENRHQSTVDHLSNYQPEKPLINENIENRYENPSDKHYKQVKKDFIQNINESSENRNQCTVDHLSNYQPEKPLINEPIENRYQNPSQNYPQQVKKEFIQNINESQENRNQCTVDHLSNYQPEKPLINEPIENRYQNPSVNHHQQVKKDFIQNVNQSQENRNQCTVDHLSNYQPEKPLINEQVGDKFEQRFEQSRKQIKDNFIENLNQQQENKNQCTVDHLSTYQPEKPLINESFDNKCESNFENNQQQIKENFFQNQSQQMQNRDQCTVDHMSNYQPEKPLILSENDDINGVKNQDVTMNSEYGTCNVDKKHEIKNQIIQNEKERIQNEKLNKTNHLENYLG